MKSGIYMIINKLNNKRYIGSAENIHHRFRIHKGNLKKQCHHSKHLQSAWNKYGEICFEFKTIEFIEISDLVSREQFWLDHYNSYDDCFGYNMLKVAGSSKGFKHSDETKKYLSIIAKGNKYAAANKNAGAHRVKAVILKDEEGNIFEYPSITGACSDLGFPRCTASIYRVLKGKQKQYKGFIWNYK